jgi:prolyl 4-hydroxylase
MTIRATTAGTADTAAPQPVTDELRRWIVAQAEAGCRPEDVLEAMVQSGWREEVATAALEATLREHLEKIAAARRAAGLASGLGAAPLAGHEGAAAGAAALDPTAVAAAPADSPSGGPASAATAFNPSAATPTARLPKPRLAASPTWLDAGDRAVRVVMQMAHPRVVVFAGLLSEDECDELVALARPRLARSETVETASGGSEVNAARTSDGMFFERGEAPVIARIERRIAALLHWPVVNGEGLQVLRYRPGAEYRPHHDWFDPAHAGTASILKRGGQRVGTLLLYLNTPPAGGGTTFPDVGLEVAPQKGYACFFSYERAHADTRTLHGGAPVLEGEKWVATKWLREGEFR